MKIPECNHENLCSKSSCRCASCRTHKAAAAACLSARVLSSSLRRIMAATLTLPRAGNSECLPLSSFCAKSPGVHRVVLSVDDNPPSGSGIMFWLIMLTVAGVCAWACRAYGVRSRSRHAASPTRVQHRHRHHHKSTALPSASSTVMSSARSPAASSDTMSSKSSPVTGDAAKAKKKRQPVKPAKAGEQAAPLISPGITPPPKTASAAATANGKRPAVIEREEVLLQPAPFDAPLARHKPAMASSSATGTATYSHASGGGGGRARNSSRSIGQATTHSPGTPAIVPAGFPAGAALASPAFACATVGTGSASGASGAAACRPKEKASAHGAGQTLGGAAGGGTLTLVAPAPLVVGCAAMPSSGRGTPSSVGSRGSPLGLSPAHLPPRPSSSSSSASAPSPLSLRDGRPVESPLLAGPGGSTSGRTDATGRPTAAAPLQSRLPRVGHTVGHTTGGGGGSAVALGVTRVKGETTLVGSALMPSRQGSGGGISKGGGGGRSTVSASSAAAPAPTSAAAIKSDPARPRGVQLLRNGTSSELRAGGREVGRAGEGDPRRGDLAHGSRALRDYPSAMSVGGWTTNAPQPEALAALYAACSHAADRAALGEKAVEAAAAAGSTADVASPTSSLSLAVGDTAAGTSVPTRTSPSHTEASSPHANNSAAPARGAQAAEADKAARDAAPIEMPATTGSRAGGAAAGGGSFSSARAGRLKPPPAPLWTSGAPTTADPDCAPRLLPVPNVLGGAGASPPSVPSATDAAVRGDGHDGGRDGGADGAASRSGPSERAASTPAAPKPLPPVTPSSLDPSLSVGPGSFSTAAFASSKMHASPPPPPPAAALLSAFSSPPRTDVAPWRLPDAYEEYPKVVLPHSAKAEAPAAGTAVAGPLPKKKKNKAAQAQRVQLAIGGSGPEPICPESAYSVESCG